MTMLGTNKCTCSSVELCSLNYTPFPKTPQFCHRFSRGFQHRDPAFYGAPQGARTARTRSTHLFGGCDRRTSWRSPDVLSERRSNRAEWGSRSCPSSENVKAVKAVRWDSECFDPSVARFNPFQAIKEMLQLESPSVPG